MQPNQPARRAPGPALRLSMQALLALATCLGAVPAVQAQVYKCANAQGGTVYSQAPCAAAGLREVATLKAEAPPPAVGAGRASGPPPAGASAPPSTSARRVPPGVDDPLGDPDRPRKCAEQQKVIDAALADTHKAIAARSKAQAAFDDDERRINEYNASRDGRRSPAIVDHDRYQRHQVEDSALLREVGYQRIALRGAVCGGYRLNCQVIARPLQLKQAEQLMSRSVGE